MTRQFRLLAPGVLALFAAAIIFMFYLLAHEPTISAVLAAIVSVLGFGPTVTKAW